MCLSWNHWIRPEANVRIFFFRNTKLRVAFLFACLFLQTAFFKLNCGSIAIMPSVGKLDTLHKVLRHPGGSRFSPTASAWFCPVSARHSSMISHLRVINLHPSVASPWVEPTRCTSSAPSSERSSYIVENVTRRLRHDEMHVLRAPHFDRAAALNFKHVDDTTASGGSLPRTPLGSLRVEDAGLLKLRGRRTRLCIIRSNTSVLDSHRMKRTGKVVNKMIHERCHQSVLSNFAAERPVCMTIRFDQTAVGNSRIGVKYLTALHDPAWFCDNLIRCLVSWSLVATRPNSFDRRPRRVAKKRPWYVVSHNHRMKQNEKDTSSLSF